MEASRRRASGARLRGSDYLAAGDRRRILGAHASAFQRAGAGGVGLLHRPYHGSAELAAPSQHRAPPGARRDQCLDGAGIRVRRLAAAVQVFKQLLGKARRKKGEGRSMTSIKYFLVALAVVAVPALAQDATSYPSKPIRIIVPFTPGSATDIVARLVGEKLNAAWGQPVIVENRPGAGGTIGIAQTAKADPDGYTLAARSTRQLLHDARYH